MHDVKELGRILDYKLSRDPLSPDYRPDPLILEALRQHMQAYWRERAEIVTEHFKGSSREMVILTQADRLCTIVMTSEVYRSDYKKNRWVLTAEFLTRIPEKPELRIEPPAQEQSEVEQKRRR